MTSIAMMKSVKSTMLVAALLSVGAAAAVGAQSGKSIAERIQSAPDGTVRFTFRPRPSVCGEGNSISTSGNHSNWNGHGSSRDVEWDNECDHGPVRMVLDVSDHAVTKIHTYVGGRWRQASNVTDLGEVRPQGAVDYLLGLARSAQSDVGHEAIFPATIADSVVVWPTLVSIARDERIPNQTRRDAVFWLGQFAGDAATSNLTQLVGDDTLDRKVRESAVFALSQRPREEGVPVLIRVAQTNKDPEIRRKALFWLGQSNDPRALALFEQLLEAPASRVR